MEIQGQRIGVTSTGAAEAALQRDRFFAKYAGLFDQSAAMRDLEKEAIRAGDTADPVLLIGEPGTGKEVVARTIHFLSARWAGPVVKLNVTSLPSDMVEAELFGDDTRVGTVERAAGGSLILHEVGELSMAAQSRLLGLLDDPGCGRVRLLATASRDLSTPVADSSFRRDLFYRLDALRIVVPPLRERREEIPHLVNHFRQRFAEDFRRPLPNEPPELIGLMMAYDWPGNVRELEHLIKRWVVLGDEEQLLHEVKQRSEHRHALGAVPVVSGSAAGESLRDIARRAAREAERLALQAALAQAGGNRAAAARALKISYKTLLQKTAEAGLANPRRGKRQ
jgi:two-component system, NtrC family, response regulator AtoC